MDEGSKLRAATELPVGRKSLLKSPESTDRENVSLTGTKKPTVGSGLVVQVLATIAAGWAQVSEGSTVVLSGAILPQLTNSNTTDLLFEEADATFFSSSPNIGAIMGSLVAGLMMVVLGQRVSILTILPIYLASWITIAYSRIIIVVQVMRIIQGASMGILSVASATYVTEFADERRRGMLNAIVALIRSLGMFLPFGLGATSMSWRHMALVCGIVSIVPAFLGFLFFPNSPRWLASHGRYEEAEKALRFLRGQRCDITSEMSGIRRTVEYSKMKPTLMSQLLQLRKWTLLKRFLRLIFIIFLAQFSGYFVIFSYALTIFQSVSVGLDPLMCILTLGLFRSFSGVLQVLIIDRINRRKLLLISFLICAVSMTCMGAYIYVQVEVDDSQLATSLSFLPLTCVLMHIFFACIGLGLVLLMTLETLPLSFRSLGSGITDAFAFFSIFLTIQAFPYMNRIIRPYGTFWVYACCCLATAFVSMAFLPETRGRTLEVIELSSM